MNQWQNTQAVSVARPTAFLLFSHLKFSTNKTSTIFHLQDGSLTPLARKELPPLFVVSLGGPMILIYNDDAVSPSLACTRLIASSTPMDPLVGGKETGVQQKLPLENSQSSLKWLPSSKAKEERSPIPTRRKLPRNQHYSGHPPVPIILQSLYSFAEIQNHYVKLLFYQILAPLQFTIPLTPSRLPSSFNGSLAILLFQLTN